MGFSFRVSAVGKLINTSRKEATSGLRYNPLDEAVIKGRFYKECAPHGVSVVPFIHSFIRLGLFDWLKVRRRHASMGLDRSRAAESA